MLNGKAQVFDAQGWGQVFSLRGARRSQRIQTEDRIRRRPNGECNNFLYHLIMLRTAETCDSAGVESCRALGFYKGLTPLESLHCC